MDHKKAVTIREMRPADLAFAESCTAGEGWLSEDRTVLEGFFAKEIHGCLLAEENLQPIGVCIATRYGKSGFIGELIVHPEARGKGVGAALLNHGVSVLKAGGVETIYLDGVLSAVDLYERNGFRKICRSWRYSGHLTGEASPHVRRMVVNDLAQVSTLDLHAFGEDRSFYLKRRLELFPKLSFVMVDRERITGYILGREGVNWLSAGPWVVSESVENPMDLLHAFALEAHGRSISLGVLDTNREACELVQVAGFIAREDSPWRMALGPACDLGASPNCLAIGSAAKG